MFFILLAFPTKQIDSLILNTEKFAISEYSTKNILIGNSASDTNKHYEIIDYLSKFRNQNLKINASLAYGDKLYGIKVCEKGKNVFWRKVHMYYRILAI